MAYEQRDDAISHILHEMSFMTRPRKFVYCAPISLDVLANGARNFAEYLEVCVREDYVSIPGHYSLQQVDQMRTLVKWLDPREVGQYFACLVAGLRVMKNHDTWIAEAEARDRHGFYDFRNLSAALIVAASRVFR